jgi:pyruvate kinase
MNRRTKIVATLGPASREPQTIRELIEAGADAFRLNFSHGDTDQHLETIERVRNAADEAGLEV